MMDFDKVLDETQRDIYLARFAAYGRAFFIQRFGPERGPEKQEELGAKLREAIQRRRLGQRPRFLLSGGK